MVYYILVKIYISSICSCEKKILLVQSSLVKIYTRSFFDFFLNCRSTLLCISLPRQCQILLSRPFSFFANEFFRSMSDYVFIAVCIKLNLMIIMISNQQPCIFGQCLFCNTVVSAYRKFCSTQVLG